MTGSIEKRGKNSYRLVVFKGYDLDGKPIRHQKTILEHHRLLSAMLHKAVYWQLIVSNPVNTPRYTNLLPLKYTLLLETLLFLKY